MEKTKKVDGEQASVVLNLNGLYPYLSADNVLTLTMEVEQVEIPGPVFSDPAMYFMEKHNINTDELYDIVYATIRRKMLMKAIEARIEV